MRLLKYTLAFVLTALIWPALALAQEVPGTEGEGNITELDAWNGLVAIAIPFLVAVLTTASMDWKLKVAISVFLSVVASVITTGLEHGWHVDDGHFVRSLLTIVVLSQTFYRMFKPAVVKVESNVGVT